MKAADIVLDLGPTAARCLEVSRGGSMRLRRGGEFPWPPDTQTSTERGTWLGDQLERAGFARGRAIVSLGRDQAVVKRLSVPTTEPSEVPEMARLSMQQELPFEGDDAAIDVLPLGMSEQSTEVLAAAVSGEVFRDACEVAEAAGYTPSAVTLRCLGTAALAGDGAVLVIDVTRGGIEFTVLDNGGVRFSRAGDFPRNGGEPGDAIETETRRTWMSYKVGNDGASIDRCMLMGDEASLASAVTRLAGVLNSPVEILSECAGVTGDVGDRLWPLAGLLLAEEAGRPGIDFLHPRRAPDLAARRRRMSLAAVAATVFVIGGLWTAGNLQMSGLRAELADLKRTQRNLQGSAMRYFRDRYRLEHLEQWQSVEVDWLAHLQHLQAMSPTTDRLVLDSWRGSIDFKGVKYDKKQDAWSAEPEIMIVLDGEAIDRATADALREELVSAESYQVDSPGSESTGGRRMPVGFTYRLATEAANEGAQP
ncbi:MAG: hypothetical protein QGH76_06095 [Phycisphaerales bacterium]|nr:hypothetical protein [Phycisphaerales bacterium]